MTGPDERGGAPEDPWAPPPAGWRPPARPAPPPPPPPPYGAPPGWLPQGQPPPPPYGAPPGWVPQGQPGQPPYGWTPAYAPPRNTNGFAIASLVVSIVVGWLPYLGAIVAIGFGIIGLRQTRARHEGGRGLAIAGIVIGAVGILLWTALIVAGASGSSSGSDTVLRLPA